MSRTMPTACQHGRIIDQGDFGPHESEKDCDDEGLRLWGLDGRCGVCFPECPDCRWHSAIEWAAAVERMTTVRQYILSEIRHMSDENALLYVVGANRPETAGNDRMGP